MGSSESENFGWQVAYLTPNSLADPTCLAFGCAVRRATICGVGDDLNPEIADNYSMSIDWTPEAVPGLHWTVHWSRVDFTDKIEYSYNLLFSEPEVAFTLPEIIERDADGNAIRAFARYINLSGKVSEILTTELEYSFVNDFGAFRPRLSYTRVLEEHFTILPGAEPVNRVGTTWGSNEYGLVGSVEWTSGKYGADLFVRYTPSYENDRTGTCLVLVGRCERLYGPRPSMTVDSYTTVDLTASYRFENGLRLRGGGRNVLDADPPAGIYAKIVTRISEVWMSLTGIFNSHLIMSKAVERFGTQAQRDRFLPRFASGEIRGGLALTEPNCGTDLQAIRTTAVRQGGNFTINGTKTWISNGIEGSCFALLVKTDPEVRPRHRGMSLFLAEKANGLSVGRKLGKLGYKGIDSAELVFENYQVSEDNLIGGEEGQGFYQTVGGLELGRINVAARGVGIANAALKEATSYSQVRETMGKPICEH